MINDEGLIKKSAVLKLLRNLKENRPYANLDTTLDVAAVNVRKMPTADVVEVVHGEWIKADSMPRSAKCSECNCWITRHTINENWFRYCPHCGAKMDGKNEHKNPLLYADIDEIIDAVD